MGDHRHDEALKAKMEPRLRVISMDLLDEASVHAALAEIDQRLGGLDVLINNAGSA